MTVRCVRALFLLTLDRTQTRQKAGVGDCSFASLAHGGCEMVRGGWGYDS